MSKNFKCYLQCSGSLHNPIFLPNGLPVVLGRLPQLKITDPQCSRNQLELTANYDKRYVLVKRLGANTSQIEGIEIERNKSMQLLQNQSLYFVNMKYPHFITFDGEDSLSGTFSSSAKVTNLPVHKKAQSKSSKPTFKKLKLLSSVSPLRDKNAIQDEYTFKDSPVPIRKTKTNEITESSSSHDSLPETNKKSTKAHWSQGLKGAMENPELIVFKDNKIVIIKDKYPKAKYHWLVLPQENISNTSKLNKQHLPLLQHMLEEGKKLAEDQCPTTTFKYGYHAVASMSQLHMHVISQDFCSTYLKTKKHWNSFTTEYFVDAKDILIEIENDSKVKDRKTFSKYLNEPLKITIRYHTYCDCQDVTANCHESYSGCHICGNTQKNMPCLKKHIQGCS